jgi:hypothetical protein
MRLGGWKGVERLASPCRPKNIGFPFAQGLMCKVFPCTFVHLPFGIQLNSHFSFSPNRVYQRPTTSTASCTCALSRQAAGLSLITIARDPHSTHSMVTRRVAEITKWLSLWTACTSTPSLHHHSLPSCPLFVARSPIPTNAALWKKSTWPCCPTTLGT